jgi:rod shape determining protein RodA
VIARAVARAGGVADGWLLLPLLVLAPLGALVIEVATSSHMALPPAHVTADAARQAAYLVVGLVAMFTLAHVDYRLLRRLAPATYVAALAALVLVLALGSSQFGARRWLAIGTLTVQPSEFAKLAMLVAGAALAADRDPRARPLLAWLALLAIPTGLVLLEPDLGTALVVGAAWLAMVIAWGLPWRTLAGMAIAALAVIPLVYTVAVPDYQRERLAVFVHPGRDPLGSGFTLRQVEVAFGSGGLFGNGMIEGAHSALEGLATRTSDFVFAQIGEAFGLVGAVVVIATFAIVAWRGLRAATVAPDAFGRLLAVGLTTTITAQALMHIAVNLRLFPATGIALPFVSQGGSALVTMFAAIGLLESIAAHRPATAREQWSGERWH